MKIKPDHPIESGWHGYDSIGNLAHLGRLLSGENRTLFGRIGNKAVADIGCAHGDLGFFRETLGFEIDFIDWPATNWNGARRVMRLIGLLDSRVQVHAVELDEYFKMPGQQYKLALLSSIQYHLKNPFHVLERLARTARHCPVGSPGVPSCAGRRRPVEVQCLLAADESENGDATNYWIFTAPGLRRLCQRSGWKVLDFMTVGDCKASDPSSTAPDERAFALLRSRVEA